mmetsp:Transcript_22743/g.47703  ORF Transcript_22743/g.47703 Transcript_22743/m.47703 type:complete len:260 (+) Transcript_22743:107-886(+)
MKIIRSIPTNIPGNGNDCFHLPSLRTSTTSILVSLTATAILLTTLPTATRALSATTSSSSTSSHAPHEITTPLPPPNPNRPITPTPLQKLSLKLGLSKHLRERVVHSYFHGVGAKNIPQIETCFSDDGAIIRDICNLANPQGVVNEEGELVGKLAMPRELGERCAEFLGAHPDCCVRFHYGPTCGRGRTNKWVHAHWYETGTFSGTSRGISPDNSPLNVQGQTRFWVDDDLKIKEIVITRTFSQWEESLIRGMLVGKEE